MKSIRQINADLIGERAGFTLEEKLVLACNLYCSLMCFISIFLNYTFSFSYFSVFLAIVSFGSYASGFFIGRYFRLMNLSKLVFTLYTFLFCNIYWYVNYGSQGSAMYIFLLYYSIMLFIWSGKQIGLITAVLALNLIVLFILELKIPGLIPAYPTFTAKITDIYGTLLMILGFFFIFIISVKNNYIQQYKKAQQSDKLKSAFLTNMSHEIRTPLNAILGFTQLISKKDISEEKRLQYSHLIDENGKYLVKLISDILDISLIESGQLKVLFHKVEINSIFKKLYFNVTQSLQDLERTEVDLILDIPDEPFYLETDDLRVEQVLNNLLNNAVKFTVTGFIKFGYYREDKQLICFVEDTGKGIKEEFQSEVFSRFVKNDELINLKLNRGAGIGLALSKDLISLLNGKIWFTSKYLHGSKFYFSLPLK